VSAESNLTVSPLISGVLIIADGARLFVLPLEPSLPPLPDLHALKPPTIKMINRNNGQYIFFVLNLIPIIRTS
jgi:hypothetical protein